MGKASMEPKVLEELDQYCGTFIEPNLNQPINMRHGLSQATCNIVSQMMYGKRFDYNDDKFNKMMEAIFETEKLSLKVAMASCLPTAFANWLMKSTVERSEYISDNILLPILQSYVDEHKEVLDRDNPQDITDRFLIHSEQMQEDKDACYSGVCYSFSSSIFMSIKFSAHSQTA